MTQASGDVVRRATQPHLGLDQLVPKQSSDLTAASKRAPDCKEVTMIYTDVWIVSYSWQDVVIPEGARPFFISQLHRLQVEGQ